MPAEVSKPQSVPASTRFGSPTALATRSIRIARSTLDDRAGVIGAAVMVIESVLAPDAVDLAIAGAGAS